MSLVEQLRKRAEFWRRRYYDMKRSREMWRARARRQGL